MPLSESPDQRTYREFESEQCPVCNGKKRKRTGFCSRCYFSLPKDLRDALWQRFGNGYELAHEEAREWLEQERRAAG